MGSSTRTARTGVLRPVLEIALGVARSAEGRAVAPKTLAPVAKMQRVGSRAWAVVDRAGDDEAFRAAVGSAVDAEELDDACRLWLTRPDGWEADLDELVDAQRSSVAAEDAERELRRERRARQRAEDEREALRTQVDQLDAALAATTATTTDLVGRADEAAERADQAAAERAEAVRQLGEERQLHQRTHEELRRLRAELDRAERDRAERGRVERAEAAGEAGVGDGGAVETGADAAPAAVDEVPPPPSEPPPSPFDQTAAAAAVAVASSAAAALAGALDELSGLLAPARKEEARPGRSSRPDRPRRQAPPLPGGIHDDSVDAADHLVRLPGCVLLVDGYNATLATWADEELPAQRRRLLTALGRLEARVGGLDATVVFDGTGERRLGRSPSRHVHVVFTDAGTEADDVILAMVDQVDPDRPVVVASDDGRVRAGARRRGARPIGITQLQAVMG